MSSNAAVKITSKLSPVAGAAAVAASEAFGAKAPQSVLSIPSSVRYGPISISDLKNDSTGKVPSAAIRQVGATRRIFLLNSHMTGEEMDGLAHRIKILGKNSGLNSILLSNNLEQNSCDDVDFIFPSSALDICKPDNTLDCSIGARNDEASPKERGTVWDVAGGYDARALVGESPDEKREVLNAMMRLALSIKGNKVSYQNVKNDYASKIPFISVTHGSLSDGGYAFAMGSYAFVTPDSRFSIQNPSRGLSFDPIGLSFILPRLGWEHKQAASNYPLGSVLAYTGFVADGFDMIESGLATNYIDSTNKVGYMERALSELPSYSQQGLRKAPIKKYGQSSEGTLDLRDVNGQYRNVAVANLLHDVCDFDAAGQDYASPKHEASFRADEDPSLVLDGERMQYFEERSSILMTAAATFDDVFRKEDTVQGMLDQLRQYTSVNAKNEEHEKALSLAKDLLEGMESQSPLALHAVHKLLRAGRGKKQTLESCMEREKIVLLNLFEKEDYKNWAKSGLGAGEFKDWKHKSVHEVTKDEVEELFQTS